MLFSSSLSGETLLEPKRTSCLFTMLRSIDTMIRIFLFIQAKTCPIRSSTGCLSLLLFL